MRHLSKALTSVAIIVTALTLATAGWAYWSSIGSGSGSASVGTLTLPGTPAGTVTSGTASLGWSASTVSDGGLVKYHVERSPDSGTTWADACGSTAGVPTSGASCSDTPGAGTYVYRVKALYRSWTAQSGTSAPIVININPTITSVSPNSRGQSANNQNVVIAGTGFVNGATVSFSGTGITVNTTTFNSSTQLTANITIAANATTGVRTLTITNPDAGTGSLTGGFTINATPTITSASPNSRGQSANNQNVVIAGTGFVNGATVSFSGTGITVNTTTFNSSTQLTANITIAANATTGVRDVTVNNNDGSSPVTKTSTFTVNVGPTIASPSSGSPYSLKHNQDGTLLITGTGFQSGITVSVSGGFTTGTVTLTGTTQISVPISATNSQGTYNLTVTNPDGGRAVSTGSLVNN